MQPTVTNQDVVGNNPIDPKYYVRVFLRRKWLILAVFAVVVSSVTAYTLRQPKVYSASTSVIIDVTAPKFLDKEVQDVTDSSYSNYWANREYYETQHKVITSRAVSQRVVEKLGLQADPSFQGADAPARLQGKISVKPVKDSRIVNIVIEDQDPKRAALLANEVAEAYMAENQALRLKITESASQWLEERRESLEERSNKSELALYDFKKSADMLTTKLEDAQSMVSQRLNVLNAALTETRLKIAGLRARVEAIRSVQKANKDSGGLWAEAIPGAAENNTVQSYKTRYVQQNAECVELKERYLPDHPKLAACLDKLRLFESDLVRELNNIVVSAEADLKEAVTKEKNLSALFDAAKAEAFEVNKKQIEFEQLKRESDNNQRLYDLVLKRLKDIELSGLLRVSNVRVLDAARPSFAPVRPNVRNNILLALVIGLLGGFGLALLLEFLDSSVTSQTEIEEQLGLPFLGFIPSIADEKAPIAQRDLHIHHQPKSSVAECCRAIRTNLLFMSPDDPFKSLVVTSSGPQEGKSTTVINLGITMAQSGNKVLLIDTDMRRPRLHKAFGVPNDIGVSSLVVGEGSAEGAVKATEVPNLFVLPCGPIPPNPAELLHTQAFNELLKKLSLTYDRVILDSPPIGAVADAVVLSTRVSGVVMVLKGGSTQREVAKRAVKQLQDVRAKLFGAILNDINLEDSKYEYYYYAYRRYGYYYGEKKEESA
ncbi:MAG: GumC family protein [Myxococcota bacterium]